MSRPKKKKIKAECELKTIYLDIERILSKADRLPEVYTMESEVQAAGYAIDSDEAIIVTRSRGYLRINEGDIPTIIEELQYIREEMERRRQCKAIPVVCAGPQRKNIKPGDRSAEKPAGEYAISAATLANITAAGRVSGNAHTRRRSRSEPKQ